MEVGDLLPEFGWCVALPTRPPRKCRWCNGALRLSRGRAVACKTCDETGWWQGGGTRRRAGR